ncbi:hypothetical protein [Bradyrhizobium sp.]|uniref:hypothetical protein n=1 Tax=Bradyrhizobium sp. TaxID=376 RepID=UPI003C5EF9FA
MAARKKGRFILLSSIQGKHGTKDASSYSASKWGILEVGRDGVRRTQHHGERPDTRPRR